MKAAVVLLALVLTAFAPQQQTFYSAKAEPKPVPAHTAQPVDAGYLYYAANCGYGYSSKSKGYSSKGGHNNCSSRRPTPRPSTHPVPRPSYRPGPLSSHQP